MSMTFQAPSTPPRPVNLVVPTELEISAALAGLGLSADLPPGILEIGRHFAPGAADDATVAKVSGWVIAAALVAVHRRVCDGRTLGYHEQRTMVRAAEAAAGAAGFNTTKQARPVPEITLAVVPEAPGREGDGTLIVYAARPSHKRLWRLEFDGARLHSLR